MINDDIRWLRKNIPCPFCEAKDWHYNDHSGIPGVSAYDIYFECRHCRLRIFATGFPPTKNHIKHYEQSMKSKAIAYLQELKAKKSVAFETVAKLNLTMNKMGDSLKLEIEMIKIGNPSSKGKESK